MNIISTIKLLSKTGLAAGIICAALAFTTSCSGDKDSGTGKWCVIDGGGAMEMPECAEIGKSYINNKEQKMTEDVCNMMSEVASIKDEKPEDCRVITEGDYGYSDVVYGDSLAYGGETYPTVVIGSQTWMAKNLNYETEGSTCYEDNAANCGKYGRLYNWEAAGNACPKGWHLPSEEEWKKLILFVNSEGEKLKSKSGWNSNNGTDSYGFSLLPGGCYSFKIFTDDFDRFKNIGEVGYWWGSTEANWDEFNNRYDYSMYYICDICDIISGGGYNKENLYSVRCIKD